MRRLFPSLVSALALAAAMALAPARAAEPLTVVELFTSQGCSSCPPADEYLGVLAKQRGILALSEHVDYWDYIGWKDPFASPETTARQRAYGRDFGMSYVYTPQLVIQGMTHVTGSDRTKIQRLIKELSGARRLAVTATRDGDGLKIAIPAADWADGPARVLVALFDFRQENEVRRGENAGRTLSHTNVVRAMTEVGSWNGAAKQIVVPAGRLAAKGRDGCAVLVQSTRNGRSLGAARVDL